MKHYKVDIKQYVTFDQKTGQILSIGPSYNEGACYIEVSDKEVEPIKSLQEKMTDYIVAYNRKNKVFAKDPDPIPIIPSSGSSTSPVPEII